MQAGGKSALSQKSDEPPLRTDEQLATLAGTSRDTIRKVSKKPITNSLGDPFAGGHPKSNATHSKYIYFPCIDISH